MYASLCENLSNCFPKWLYSFAFLPAKHEDFNCFTSLISIFFILAVLVGWEEGSAEWSYLQKDHYYYYYFFGGASLVAQSVKHLPAVQETWVRSLGWEDPLEKEMATHSSILAWKISWTGEPGGLQSMGSQRIGHDWATNTYLLTLVGWERYLTMILICILLMTNDVESDLPVSIQESLGRAWIDSDLPWG